MKLRGTTSFCLIVVWGLVASASDILVVEFQLTHIPSSWKSGFSVEIISNQDSGQRSVLAGSGRQRSVPIWARVYTSKTVRDGISGTFSIEGCDFDSYIYVDISRNCGSALCHREEFLATSRILVSRLLKPDVFYFEDATNLIIHDKKRIPTQISIYRIPNSDNISQDGTKKVLMITRGTRGDVQPFVASARQLAELHAFHVTICTESNFQKFIEGNSRVARGSVDFVPSGGNTANRIKNTIAKIFMSASSAAVQAIILSRMELEFFDSEPIMYEIARRLRPDAIIYGFTLTSLATSISEALRIPIVGFILQPTVLPSRHYDPIIPIPDLYDQACSAELIANLRALTQGISKIRRRRNLQAVSALHDPWAYLIRQSSPMVVPVPEHAFGGRPHDWPSEITMTDFIYLSDSNHTRLSPELESFLNASGGPILAITFSSMPVSKSTMNEIALSIATKSATKPRIIIIGKSPSADSPRHCVEEKLDLLRNSKQLIEVTNAPFDVLFPRISAAIIHGGLGTTAEAMRAGLPVIVTGTLLMDQRFWGDRVHALGIGPQMMSIDKFVSSASAVIDEFFRQENFIFYKQNAVLLSHKFGERNMGGTSDALVSAILSACPADFVDVKSDLVNFTQATMFMGRAFAGLTSSALRFVIHSMSQSAPRLPKLPLRLNS